MTLGGILFVTATALAWTAWLSPWLAPVADLAQRLGLRLDWLTHMQRVSLGSPAGVNTVATVAVICGLLFIAWCSYARRGRRTGARRQDEYIHPRRD